jgi:hypothetical protein
MARLTSKQRKALPASKFAGPGRSFPITDKNHAKAALIDVGKAKGLSSGEKAKIKSRAHGLLDKIGK